MSNNALNVDKSIDQSHTKRTLIKVVTGRKNIVFTLLFLLILPITLVISSNSTVYAHSSVSQTVPADGETLAVPPSEIEIFFNENITMSSNGITLYNAEGEEVPVSPPDIVPNEKSVIASVKPIDSLETSWYAVSWRAISQDGHPIQGSFTFNAGSLDSAYDPTRQAADPTEIYRDIGSILRTLGYLAIILTVGFFAAIYVLATSPKLVNLSTKFALASIGLGLIVTPLVIVNNALILNGGTFTDYQPAFMIALQSSTGTSLLLRIAAYFGLATAVLLSSEKNMRIVSAVIGFASTAALAVSYAISGHANAVDATNLASISIVVHILAGGIWLGGLPALALAFRKKNNLSDEQLVSVVDRFSIAATVSVLLVLSFGIAASFTMFEEFGDIFSDYGYVLLIKFGLVSLLALLGAYNHFFVLPSLRKTLKEETDGTTSSNDNDSTEIPNDSNEKTTKPVDENFSFTISNPRKHLGSILKLEALAFLAVAITTGFLTSYPAPAAGGSHAAHLGLEHSHSSSIDPGVLAALAELEPKIIQNTFGDGEVQVNYRPGRTDRENEIVLVFYDKLGNEISADNVEVSFTHVDTGIGPIERSVEAKDGRNILNTRDLGIPGKWSMTVKARTGGLSAASSEVILDITAPADPDSLTSVD